MRKKPGEKFHQFLLITVVLSLLLIPFATSTASADELRKRFTYAVLQKLFEIGKARGMPPYWTWHLHEAVIVVRYSPEFGGVGDEMAGRVKRLLSTPERALRVIGGTEFKSTFNAEAVKVFRSYLSEASTGTMLLIYYSDQIVAEIDALISTKEGDLLKQLREIFLKRPTREEFLAMTDGPLKTAMSQMAREGRFSKIRSLLMRYQEAVKVKNGGDIFYFFSLGLGYDSVFAQIHGGTYEKKMGAFGILLEDESCGSFVFRKRHLIEILRNPDQRFRREAARQFIARRHFRTDTLETAVDGLLKQSSHYSPGEAEFEEAIETAVILLQYPEERIAEFLVDPASPRRIAAACSLGWLQTDTAFQSLYASYFSSADADPKFLEVLVEAVYRCAAASSPERRETALKFFGHLLKTETDPVVLSAVLWRLRDLLSGRVLFLPQLFHLLKTETISPAVRAKVILIFSNFGNSSEAFSSVEEAVLPFLRAKILPFLEATADPELRLSASIFFLAHEEKHPQALSVLKDLLAPESYSRLSEPSKRFLREGLGKYTAEIPNIGMGH